MSDKPIKRLDSRPKLPHFTSDDDSTGFRPNGVTIGRRLIDGLRATRRLGCAIGWTLLAIPIQGVLLMLPGRAKADFARFYWSVFTMALGLRVRLIGAPLATGCERRVVYAASHCSWLDVPVLGGTMRACFVSKDVIANWPGINLVAKLGRTVFVTRRRGATGRERDDMRARLLDGDNLMLFPEGTSSDGTRVLPFRSAFFSVVEGQDPPPLIQPISVCYDRLAGLPTRRSTRTVFAWFGDMDLASHAWRLAQFRGMRVTILVHPALDPLDFPNRKVLAQAAWDAVAAGAAAMRQNREDQVLGFATPQASAAA